MSEEIDFREERKYSVVVNAIIVNNENKVLLVQRGWQEKHGPGTWSVPGGKLDFTGVTHNALQETAKKEALEEAGVEIEDEMELIANNTFEHDEDKLQVVALVFLCYYKSGVPKVTEETADVKWVGLEEINNFNFHNINVKNYVLKAFKKLDKK